MTSPSDGPHADRQPVGDSDELLSDSSHAALDPQGVWANLERRVFGSNQFFRLWLAQTVTSMGDWIFFLAITITAARIGGGSPEAAVGLVVGARIVPGFFLAQLAGVLADRWDRRRLMVVCDVGRAGVVLFLPFVDTLWQLVIASLALEAFTLLWIPAKEASVPNLVPKSHLTTANSLALLATYGTFPLASLLFVGLAAGGDRLEDLGAGEFLRIDQASLAFYVNAFTFVLSALLIWTLVLPRVRSSTSVDGDKLDLAATWREFHEGWRYIFINPTVRSVNLGLATGLIGGGMLIPLGSVYSIEVLGAGERGFGAMLTGLGVGVGLGVLLLSLMRKRLRKRLLFIRAVLGAGASLLVAASLNSLAGVIVAVGALGICAGAVYVIGFTLLHEEAEDEIRGRIFAALYTLVRFCVLLALVMGPFLAVAFDKLSDRTTDGSVDIFGWTLLLPGVRLTLWLAGLIIIAAGVLATTSLRAGSRARLRAVRQ